MKKMIKYVLVLCILSLVLLGGCSPELKPDSMTISYAQEQYRGVPDAWIGGGISFTWELK